MRHNETRSPISSLTKIAITTTALLALAPLARADHREPFPGARVAALAHELEITTARLHERAERKAHRIDRWEARALKDLHELDHRASQLHREVERYPVSSYRTERKLDHLLEAYDRSADTFSALRSDGRMRRDFHRIGALLDELSGCYASRYEPRPRRARPAFWFGISWRR